MFGHYFRGHATGTVLFPVSCLPHALRSWNHCKLRACRLKIFVRTFIHLIKSDELIVCFYNSYGEVKILIIALPALWKDFRVSKRTSVLCEIYG